MKQSIKVLIVEDEVILAMALSLDLQKYGFIVCGKASTGEKAVELALSCVPDIILMDINLSGSMNGIDAAAEIRLHQYFPVIFMTGYSEENLIYQLSSAEKTDYIIKPVITADLIQKIEKMLTE